MTDAERRWAAARQHRAAFVDGYRRGHGNISEAEAERRWREGWPDMAAAIDGASVLTEQDMERLAAEAEAGYDPSQIRPVNRAHHADRLAGNCPMGCGQTLELVSAGRGGVFYVHCRGNAARPCPFPMAADHILGEAETEHVVRVDEDGGWTMKHPLRERLGDQLFACHTATSRALHESDWQETCQPGVRYRIAVDATGLAVTLLEPVDDS